MPTHWPENERIKHRYCAFLREAKRQSEPSIDKAMAAIDRFEEYTRRRAFRKFHIQQAVGFKQHLCEQRSRQSAGRLSAATLNSTLNALKSFFVWLADQPGYRAVVRYADAEYFNLAEKERRIAMTTRAQLVPTMEQILHALNAMPSASDIERRDRAVLAFMILTGVRDGAMVSLKLKHVDLEQACVHQDAREVRTKFSKTFTTWFFPVDNRFRQVVIEWVEFLRSEKLWGLDDPLFPATRVTVGSEGKFAAVGLDRKHWCNATPIRTIFRQAFERLGLPYFNPHSFRKTLVGLGEQLCTTPEQFKAWSQNLGHEQVMTTFTSYGAVGTSRQAEIIRQLAQPRQQDARAKARLLALLDEV